MQQKNLSNGSAFFSSSKKSKTESENTISIESQEANPERVKFNAYLSPI